MQAVLLFSAMAVIGWLIAGLIASQSTELMYRLQMALPAVRGRLEGYQWAQELVERLPTRGEMLLGCRRL